MYWAQQLESAQTLARVQRNLPDTPVPGQVFLKVKCAGVCGSDMEYYRHGYCGGFVPRGPLVLGHEFSGEVAAVGEGVTNVQVGDAVAVDPSIPCGQCGYCRLGRYNLCENMRFLGSASCYPHLDGGFAEYVVVPAACCLRFDPKSLGWQEAALVEPLMVALSAVEKIDRIIHRHIVVFGGGTIGQLVLASLGRLGALDCTLVDPRPTARDRAKQWGVDCCSPEEVAEGRFDTCVEASGHPQALTSCYRCVTRGGLIIQVGTLAAEVTLPANLVMAKELTVRGCFRYAHLLAAALGILASGKAQLRTLITHTLPLSQAKRGLELALDPKEDTLKVQLVPD